MAFPGVAARSKHIVYLPLALVATLALQLTTLPFYFYFDDYVPFGEIVTQGGRSYLWRLVTATDLTPNWRPLPGLLYLGSWELFGMDPLPIRALMVVTHVATAGLIYYVIWRTTSRAWAACAAAMIFGLNPAYVGALSQVTTATQEMAGFFLVAALAATIECALANHRRAANFWLAVAVASYVLVIGSHEGMAIMFPVFGLALVSFDPDPRGRMSRSLIRSAPFAVIGLASALAFTTCGCNEGSTVWGTDYAWDQTLIYAGRLFYPVGLELPDAPSIAHMAAAAALGLIAVAAVVAAPRIARVGALWTLLALSPHVFIQYFTASRYLYVPSIGFALLAAAVLIVLARAASRLDARLPAVAGVPLLTALCGWYAYQTVQQDQHFAAASADWSAFHRDVHRVFPSVPPGTRVMIIGGPFQKYEYQFYILPAFAQTTWGPGVSLTDLEPGSLPAQLALISGSPYVAEYQDGELLRVHDDNGRR